MRTDWFVKVEGAGNDFLLGTGAWTHVVENPVLVRRLCNRHHGIGADGVVSLAKIAGQPAVDMEYVNADGSRGLFCGNATRCAARAAVELLAMESPLVVRTAWRDIPARVDGEQVSLELPPPSCAPRSLHLTTSAGSWSGEFMDFGVPHLVVQTDNLAAVDLPTVGPALRHHPDVGPEGCNVNFVEHRSDGSLAIRTWERGVEGETLACGSGAVVAGLLEMGASGRNAVNILPVSGNQLEVRTDGSAPVCASRLTGPARIVAEIQPLEEWLRDGV